MPYITQKERALIFRGILYPVEPGQLNFVITVEVDEYIDTKGMCYSTINEVIGVLECVKQELYRRIAAPYEDQKLEENGDVYGIDYYTKKEV